MTDRLSTTELRDAFLAPNSSTRLRTAMTAGITPDDAAVEVLVRQCAVEPDFFVRDMLTWALTRHDPAVTVDRVLRELRSRVPQARSQALHTLTKIGDRSVFPAVFPTLLHDPDDEVARAAWRAAAGLVPAGREVEVAVLLATELGRGGRDVQRSLSRAFAVLGDAAVPVLEGVADGPTGSEDVSGGNVRSADGGAADGDAGDVGGGNVGAGPSSGADAREHALATLRLIADPDTGFDGALEEARRIIALG